MFAKLLRVEGAILYSLMVGFFCQGKDQHRKEPHSSSPFHLLVAWTKWMYQIVWKTLVGISMFLSIQYCCWKLSADVSTTDFLLSLSLGAHSSRTLGICRWLTFPLLCLKNTKDGGSQMLLNPSLIVKHSCQFSSKYQKCKIRGT